MRDALVVGCGTIGSALDAGTADDRALTHATGYELHDRTRLVAGVDPDADRRDRFEAARGRPAHADLDAALDEHEPDLVSVCTPAAEHATGVERAVDAGVDGVLCEKPLAPDSAAAAATVDRCAAADVTLAVGYFRRCLPGCRLARSMLRRGVVGDDLRAVATYSKGFVENGSHVVDLARWWFGDPVTVENAHAGTDPDALLQSHGADCQLFHLGSYGYNHIQVDVHGDTGRLRLLDNGRRIHVQSVDEKSLFPGFQGYADPTAVPTGFRWMFYFVVDDLVRAVEGGTPPACSGRDALETLELCEQIQDRAES